jgi:hypothetical protein
MGDLAIVDRHEHGVVEREWLWMRQHGGQQRTSTNGPGAGQTWLQYRSLRISQISLV